MQFLYFINQIQAGISYGRHQSPQVTSCFSNSLIIKENFGGCKIFRKSPEAELYAIQDTQLSKKKLKNVKNEQVNATLTDSHV